MENTAETEKAWFVTPESVVYGGLLGEVLGGECQKRRCTFVKVGARTRNLSQEVHFSPE